MAHTDTDFSAKLKPTYDHLYETIEDIMSPEEIMYNENERLLRRLDMACKGKKGKGKKKGK